MTYHLTSGIFLLFKRLLKHYWVNSSISWHRLLPRSVQRSVFMASQLPVQSRRFPSKQHNFSKQEFTDACNK